MISDFGKNYRSMTLDKLTKALSQEKEISLAAKWIAISLMDKGWIYTSGTGHSHLLAEEIFYRAGGFARIIPILDPDLMLHVSATKSSELERMEGYAGPLFGKYPIGEKDVFIIASNSGRNSVSIEMAQHARAQGAKVIAITNLNHTQSVDSRHSSGLKLYQVCDVFLDTFGEIGDAAVAIPGLDSKMGATSTVVGAALLQVMMIEAAAICLQNGSIPEVFNSSNSDKGAQHNEELIQKYKPQIPSL